MRPRARRLGWLGAGLLAAWAAACDDEQASAVDTGADGPDFGGTGDVSLALVLPEPPVLTPCPDGWREIYPEGDEGPARCDPWPAGGRQRCDANSAHFPGEPDCAPIGETCPEGDWSEAIPSDAQVIYVRAGAAGGDGSADQPFATLAEAAAAAGPGTTIALSRGTFTEMVDLPAGVTLWGACVADTRVGSDTSIVSPEDPEFGHASLTVLGPETTVRNLRLVGARSNVLVADGASLALQDAIVEVPSFFGFGIALGSGASLTGTSLAVRGIEGQVVERSPLGILAFPVGGAGEAYLPPFIRLSRVELSGLNSGVAALAATVVLEDASVVDPLEAPGMGGEPAANGVVLLEGAEGEVRRSYFYCFPTSALRASGGTRLTLSDVVVANSATDPDCVGGPGVIATDGGRVEAERLTVLEPVLNGFGAIFGGTATVSDLLVEGASGSGLAAAIVSSGANDGGDDTQVELTRVRLVGNQGTGLLATGGATLVGTDIAILSTAALPCDGASVCQDGPLGIALAVQDGSRLELTQFELAGSALCGLQLAGGELDLFQGAVRHNVIGVNIQVPNYDYSRLTREVVYEDNQTDLDVVALPVPDPESLLTALQ